MINLPELDKVILFFSIIVILISIGIKLFMNFLTEGYSSSYHSWSIEESKKNNVLVKELNVIPQNLVIFNQQLVFKECWIERQTLIRYKYLFFKTVQKKNCYYICFVIDNNFSKNVDSNFRFKYQNSQDYFSCSGGRVFFHKLMSIEKGRIKIIITNGNNGEVVGEVYVTE